MGAATGHQIARVILDGFSDYRTDFTALTLGAKQRFLQADWPSVQQAATDRINLYDVAVRRVMHNLTTTLGDAHRNSAHWRIAREAYVDLICYRTDPELAETFYNTIYRHSLTAEQASIDDYFPQSEFDGFRVQSPRGIYRTYRADKGLVDLVGSVLDDFTLELPWEYRRRDVRNIIRALQHEIPEQLDSSDFKVDVLKWLFYRNKAAYIIGRVVVDDGTAEGKLYPFVLPILNNERGGLFVDSLLCTQDDVSILFSFTRSYFMVDARNPSECIEFLHTLFPNKSRWEIYSSIGFYKHGKSVFYRNFLTHLDQHSDQFVIAPGIKGMVMSVFTLPSLNIVFKIIKDYFAPPKEVDKATVKDRYYLVKTHDRVGRMADTQEFSNLWLPKDRFCDELLEELLNVASSIVELHGDRVLIRHVYIERRMTPLNIYVDEAEPESMRAALDEYGNAIKQLAAANIFPGDMLLKNFGVTRHGRVVFYDYDEISYLTDCNFRKIPEPLYPEQELSAEPWYSVGPNDIFPEEFPVFLFPDPRIRRMFTEIHGDLFTADYWRGIQDEIRNGRMMDILPYRQNLRFGRKLVKKKEPELA
ncbi:bifunctional isocitrate dehydrogenase kinase/phosphatase [Spongorhabdus nitratireducens]